MALKGTKTHENLKQSFASEAQANRRYLYFARRADIEGYPEIGGLFRDTAEAETGLPADDPVRFGAGKLLDPLLALMSVKTQTDGSLEG